MNITYQFINLWIVQNTLIEHTPTELTVSSGVIMGKQPQANRPLPKVLGPSYDRMISPSGPDMLYVLLLVFTQMRYVL